MKSNSMLCVLNDILLYCLFYILCLLQFIFYIQDLGSQPVVFVSFSFFMVYYGEKLIAKRIELNQLFPDPYKSNPPGCISISHNQTPIGRECGKMQPNSQPSDCHPSHSCPSADNSSNYCTFRFLITTASASTTFTQSDLKLPLQKQPSRF